MRLIYVVLAGLMLLLTLVVVINPLKCLAPFNALVEMLEPECPPVFPNSVMMEVFPDISKLEASWMDIRDEARTLIRDGARPVPGWKFLGQDRDFFKGWSTVSLRFLGVQNEQAKALCPKTSEILADSERIPTVMVSVMAPGKVVPLHTGPFKGILRVHLGLDVPDGECFIVVGGVKTYWKNGGAVMFDETYPHEVHNQTSEPRMVLFIDIKRPMVSPITRWARDSLLMMMRYSPHITSDLM